ncbi:MAG: lolD [Myxococcaceae bacterium]|nr:lolD [Myxococcaceae bacterium]
MTAHIALTGITKTYRRGADEVPVLNGVDLEIQRGERVAIMGRSGSGKSTLLNILGCLDEPSSGGYLLDGVDVAHLPDDDLSKVRNRTFGFVFQAFHLLKGMTIVENVELPMEYSNVSEKDQRHRALELLELVGLGHRVSHRPSELSGGERQRVAIARALANRPSILLADEPTGALDTRAQVAILELLTQIHASLGTTMIIVTHDPKVAEELGDRTIRISDGRVET